MTSEEEYKYWIEKFYTGTMFVPGWDQQIHKALDGLSPEDKSMVETALRALGDKICLEWAKDNRIRRIDNKDLISFGDRIKQAKKNGLESLMQEIRVLDQMVDDRLAE